VGHRCVLAKRCQNLVPASGTTAPRHSTGICQARSMHVVIVGAALAGTRTAQALRTKGFEGRITLVGAEEELPYDRPPLSKEYLAAEPPAAAALLADADMLADLDLDLRLGTAAFSIDPGASQLELTTGERLRYDYVVLATGSRARTWPLAGELAGIQVLRTVADAQRLRAALDVGPRVAVLGGGFIGSEVAAAARRRGLDTTIIEMLPTPMAAALGEQAGGLLGRMHADHGVRLRCGTTVAQVRGSGRVEQLVLDDGSVLDADLVVVGTGSEPVTEWLGGSGIDIGNGVACDETLRAVGQRNVFAAGDVASWPHPLFGRLRVEHWTNAHEHATLVAGAILGDPRPADAVPYVWSDQYGSRIQIVGRPGSNQDVTVVEDAEAGRHMAIYSRGGRVVGMLTVDAPRFMLRGRRAILTGESAQALLAELELGRSPNG
jgi:NADPH-dependent 2,4-dienoyl-CoA reductase/sulfur reductase-like enzyme